VAEAVVVVAQFHQQETLAAEAVLVDLSLEQICR
jgi:hypothetical protein